MSLHRRLRLWFVLALGVVIVAAGALWMYGQYTAEHHLPTPTAAGPEVSLSPTPTPDKGLDVNPPPSAWSGGGAALVWVAVGIVLATGLAFVAFRWYRPHS